MDLCLVSVVVPVFNTGKSAKNLVEKILASYDDVEVILVDDGSTDDSYEILKKIADKRVKLFRKDNGGPSAARNFGIEKVTGRYLLFIDSDDDIKNGFIAKLVDEMEKSNVSLVSAGILYKKNNVEKELYLQPFTRKPKESLKKFILKSLLADGRMYPAFNKIFDASVVRGNNLKFDEEMNYGEDTKFVLDYLKKKKGEIRFVLEPLYVYNVGTETSTAAKAVGVWASWKKCYKNLKKWVGKNPNICERFLLKMIYLKWRASWAKAKFF